MNDNYLVRQLLGSVRRSALFIVFVAIFLNIGIGVSWFTITRLEERTPKYIPSRANVPIEQDDLNDPIGIQSQKLTVNAQLQVNGQFYLAPSTLPADAKAGTIVFDQATNSLQYYDGNDFTQVASQKTVEALPQVAVTSLQGQSGAINFTPGAGININGTTISNSGLLGINGVAGNINVTTANGIASISLPQAIDPNATPTFNSINLSAPLPVTSGGTGVNNFNQYSLLVGNGTGPLTVTATAGSAGLCLISNNLAAPSFQACPGGVGGSAVTATTPGTANRIAKFTAGTDIGDSSITDNGSLVSVGAPVTINGGVTTTGIFSVGTLDITPGSALTVGAINQQFTLQGSGTSTITARSGSNTTTLDFQTPTSNSTITFPTEAGVVCLRNSTNCGFSTTGSGVSSVNTLTGAVTIQGTTNQVGVTVGSNIVLSTPQDIGTSSNVQFNNLTLGGNLTVGPSRTVFANNISQTAPGQPVTISATSDGITFTAYGKNFTFDSSSLGANQTICTSGVNCVAGGGTAVNLAPVGAQIDNTTSSSININKTNATGNILQLQKNGSDVAVLGNNGTFNINTITPISGNFTLGNTANNTIVQGTTSSEFRIGSVTYRFKPDAPIGTYTICTSEGNCSGLTGAVTTSGGTTGRLPKFTGSQAISDSILSESGSVITANNGSLVLQGGAGLTLGVSGGSGATGRVDFKNTTNSNTVTLQSGITSVASLTFTLPAADGGSNQCIKTNGSGVLGFGDCLSGSGGGGGVTSLNTLSGSVTLQGSSANRVTVSGAGPIVIDLPQDIATTSAVNFGTLNLNGTASAGLSVGSVGSIGRIVLSDGDATPQTVTFLPATLGANKTITIPNFTGTTATLPVTASGNVAVDSNGNIALTGTIPVGSGGTGGTTQATARSGIGAAAAGANSDITSTSLLNTITPNGTFMLGATAQTFTLQGNAGSTISASGGGGTTIIGFNNATPPAGTVSYNFDRNPIGGAGTYTVCTTTGNCLGGGAGGANTTLSNLGTVALNSDLLPSAAGARNLGSAALPFGNLYIGAAATNNFLFTGTSSAARTVTLTDNSGFLALLSPTTQQSGNLNISGTITSGAINSQTISTAANFTGTLSVAGATTIQSALGLTLGSSFGTTTPATGQIVLRNSANVNTVTLRSGVTGVSYTSILPTAQATTNNQCLKVSDIATGQLFWDPCAGGSGPTAGDVVNGGNTVTANMILGTNTNSNFALGFKTNGVDRWQIANSGALQYLQSTSISTPSVTGQGYSLTVSGGSGTTGGGGLSLYAGSSSGSDPGGSVSIAAGNNVSGGVGGSVNISSGYSSGSFLGGDINISAASRGGVTINSGGANFANGATITVVRAQSGAGFDFGGSLNLRAGNVDASGPAHIRNGGSVSLQGGCLFEDDGDGGGSCIGGYGKVLINASYGDVDIGSSTSAISVQGSTFAVGSLLSTNTSTNIVQLGSSNLSGTNRVQIGTGPTNSGNPTVTQLVVDTKGTAGDPSGVNGSIYYNGIAQKMRCYENGAWVDCIPPANASVWRLNTAPANTFTSIAYGGGVFVAIPNGGNVFMRSQDATNWSSVGVPASATWTSVTYGNGMFVAVSSTTNILTSIDGATWTLISGPLNDMRSVTYGNGMFVAVANGGTNRVMTSRDGISWSVPATPAIDKSWSSVTYGNGIFVAVADGGTSNRIMRSTDGTNWALQSSPADNIWSSVTYGNGMFVAVAASGTGNRVMTSTDGITWALRSSPADNSWTSVTYGNGVFAAVAASGTGNRVMTSTDGITWALRSSPADRQWVSVTYGNGMFVAVDGGANASVMVSGSALSVNTPTGNIYQGVQTFNQQLKVGYAGTATGQLYVAGNATNAKLVASRSMNFSSVMQVQGKYLYVSASSDILVYDMTVPSNPTLVTTYTLGTAMVSMRLSGRYMYALTATTMYIIDIGNPQSLSVLHSITVWPSGSGLALAVQGRYAYVYTNNGNFAVYDLAGDKIAPIQGSTYSCGSGNQLASLEVQGRYAYLACGNTIWIFNLSNPASPVFASSINTLPADNITQYTTMTVQGRYLYITGLGGKLAVYNVSNASAPVRVTSIITSSSPISSQSMYVQGRYLYQMNYWSSGGVAIYDISDPANLTSLGSFDSNVSAGTVTGRYLYANSNTGGLRVYDMGGAYIQQSEIGALDTSQLQVFSDINVGGGAAIAGGLNVGQSIQTNGLSASGTVLFRGVSNSSTAFQIQNSSGIAALITSTSNVGNTYNNADATLKVGRDTVTLRSINAAGTINASGADFAEYFVQKVPGALQPGDVVCQLSDKKVQACDGTGGTLLGAVSTNPGYIGNDIFDPANPDNTVIVALLGQVPVKVSDANGSIQPGDHLTYSSQLGVAVKATGTGMSIGMAMEELTTSDGTIMVLVRPTWYSPPLGDILQGSSLNVSGDSILGGNVAIGGNLNVSGSTTLTTLTVTGSVTIQQNLTVQGNTTIAGNLTVGGKIVTGGDVPEVVAGSAVLGATVSVVGNDISGTITIRTTNVVAPGELANILFTKNFTNKPRIVITPANKLSAGLAAYYDSATTSIDRFSLYADTQPNQNTEYQYTYFIVE